MNKEINPFESDGFENENFPKIYGVEVNHLNDESVRLISIEAERLLNGNVVFKRSNGELIPEYTEFLVKKDNVIKDKKVINAKTTYFYSNKKKAVEKKKSIINELNEEEVDLTKKSKPETEIDKSRKPFFKFKK